jgi:hypothetical protein
LYRQFQLAVADAVVVGLFPGLDDPPRAAAASRPVTKNILRRSKQGAVFVLQLAFRCFMIANFGDIDLTN